MQCLFCCSIFIFSIDFGPFDRTFKKQLQLKENKVFRSHKIALFSHPKFIALLVSSTALMQLIWFDLFSVLILGLWFFFQHYDFPYYFFFGDVCCRFVFDAISYNELPFSGPSLAIIWEDRKTLKKFGTFKIYSAKNMAGISTRAHWSQITGYLFSNFKLFLSWCSQNERVKRTIIVNTYFEQRHLLFRATINCASAPSSCSSSRIRCRSAVSHLPPHLRRWPIERYARLSIYPRGYEHFTCAF